MDILYLTKYYKKNEAGILRSKRGDTIRGNKNNVRDRKAASL